MESFQKEKPSLSAATEERGRSSNSSTDNILALSSFAICFPHFRIAKVFDELIDQTSCFIICFFLAQLPVWRRK